MCRSGAVANRTLVRMTVAWHGTTAQMTFGHQRWILMT